MPKPFLYLKELNLFFTDLDETLIDKNYNIRDDAKERISAAFQKKFIIVFASSKTLAEEIYYAKQLNIPVIYIVENGSAIYIPAELSRKFFQDKTRKEIKLSPIKKEFIVSVLRKIEKDYPDIKYYSNSTLEEISLFTGLPTHLAELARKREFTETIFRGYASGVEKILVANGLYAQKGSKFTTIGGNVDKGKAARFLIKLFTRFNYSLKRIIGIGDGENDIPLLKTVNEPYIIGNKINLKDAKKVYSFSEIEL